MDTRPPCRNFQNGGSCKFGDNCRFSHGQQRMGYAPQGYGPQGDYMPQGGNYGSQGGRGQQGGRGFQGGRGNFSQSRPPNSSNGFQGNFQYSGAPRGPKPVSNKPKSCFFYHRDKCTHANCRDLHQFTFAGDLTKTGRYELAGDGTSVVMITNTQVAAAAGNAIDVLDYQNQQVLAKLQTQCADMRLATFSAMNMNFLVFGGNANGQACLGAVHPQNSGVSYCQLQTNASLTALYSNNKVIVAGDSAGRLHICTLTAEGLQAVGQPNASPDSSPLTALTVMNDIAIAGNAQGLLIGWQLANGQATLMGYLSAKHAAPVRALDFQDNILYSAGEDGVVYRFDAANGFQYELFYPTKQPQDRQPVAITAIKLSWSRQAQVLLIGDATGKLKILNTATRQGLGTVGFYQNAPVQEFSAVVSSGVFSVLGEHTIHIMQWT